MTWMRFVKGTRFKWIAEVYEVEEPLLNNHVSLKNLSFGGTRSVSKQELLRAWASGDLVFEVFGRHTYKPDDSPIPTSYRIVDFRSLPKKTQFASWRRYQYVLPFVGMPPWLRTRQVIAAYLKQNRELIEARANAFFSEDQHALQSLRSLPRPEAVPKLTKPNKAQGSSEQELDESNTQDTKRAVAKKQISKRPRMLEAVSPASVERWLSDFTKSGYDLRSLASIWKTGKARHGSENHVRVREIIDSIFENCRAKDGKRKKPKADTQEADAQEAEFLETAASGYNTAWDVYLMVVTAIGEKNRKRIAQGKSILKAPSYHTVLRRIKEAGEAAILKRAPANKLEAQEGDISRPGASRGITRVMQRIEMDNTWLDLVVVDEKQRLPLGRPNLAFSLDVFGMPAGYYVGYEDASSATARQCLLHTILPKPDCQKLYGTKYPWEVCGKIEMLVVDCGPDFDSRDLKISCGEAGIIYEQLPVQAAWFKASAERFFRTQTTGLTKPLPGSTFSNILERGGYDPEKHACISLTAFLEMLHIFLVDYYPSKWHTEKECYPRKSWEQAAIHYEPAFDHSVEHLRTIMAHTAERTIRADGTGIEFECVPYNDPGGALYRLRSRLPKGAKVRIKIEDHDMGFIKVLDETDPEKQVWLTVPSSHPEYANGLSLWAHRIIRKFVNAEKADGHEASIQDMAEAKARIRQIVAREFMLTKKAKARRKSLRFLAGTEDQLQSGAAESEVLVSSRDVYKTSLAPEHARLQAKPIALLAIPAAHDGKADTESTTPAAPTTPPTPQPTDSVQNAPVSTRSTSDRRAGDYKLPGRRGTRAHAQ